MKTFSLAFLALSVYSASAQLKTGTIVVVGFLNNKLVIAADAFDGTTFSREPIHFPACEPFCAFGEVGVFNKLMDANSVLSKEDAHDWTIAHTVMQRLVLS